MSTQSQQPDRPQSFASLSHSKFDLQHDFLHRVLNGSASHPDEPDLGTHAIVLRFAGRPISFGEKLGPTFIHGVDNHGRTSFSFFSRAYMGYSVKQLRSPKG
jgi:hypothetical protein